MLKKLGLALTCLLCALGLLAGPLVHPASATDPDDHLVVSLNPSEQDIELRPGDSYIGSVTVYNVGQIPFNFQVEAAPYHAAGETYDPDFSTEDSYTKLKNWITFPETNFYVEPDHAVEVKFHITVPKDVMGGGQYAAIIIRTQDVSGDNPVQLAAQLAALIYGHVEGGERREEGELAKYSLPSLMLGGEFKTTSVFKNTGNVDFRITETLAIRDFFTNQEIMTPTSVSEDNQVIGTVSAAVLPNTSRTVNMFWKDAPQLGLFRVTQTISYLDQERTVEKVVLVCPIWLVLLVGAFVLLFIIWIISRIIARRRNQPQVF